MKKNKKSINIKELIVTIVVLFGAIVLGFIIGKHIFELYSGQI